MKMKEKLVRMVMDVFSLNKEEASYYAQLHIRRLREDFPQLNETQAIYCLINTLA